MAAEPVRRKTYFYVARPLLACLRLLKEGGPVPMRFPDLLASVQVSASVHEVLAELLRDKRAAVEDASTARLPVLDRWIDETIAALETRIPTPARPTDRARLDAFFRSAIDA